jgi:hypothetical protein
MRAAEVLELPAVQVRLRKSESLPTKAEKVAALQAEMERRGVILDAYGAFGLPAEPMETVVERFYPRHEWQDDPARKAIAVVIVKTGPTEFAVETDFNVGASMRQPGGPTDLGSAYRAAKAIARRHGLGADHIVTDGFELDARGRQRLTDFDELGALVMLLDMEPAAAGAELSRLLAEGVVIEPCEVGYLAERGVGDGL